jgi:hypothetical protein
LSPLRFESEIGISPQAFWAMPVMPQVNRELRPLAAMTFPARLRDATLAECPRGVDIFTSVILLFGLLPTDFHKLHLAQADAHGFDERSTSTMNRLWRHQRRLEATPYGARLTDTLEVQGHIPPLTALLMPIYKAIFRHRHAQLRRQFPLERTG